MSASTVRNPLVIAVRCARLPYVRAAYWAQAVLSFVWECPSRVGSEAVSPAGRMLSYALLLEAWFVDQPHNSLKHLIQIKWFVDADNVTLL